MTEFVVRRGEPAGEAAFVIVAGLSGAGRTTAANTFEDDGWYVVDNLPPPLIPQVADLARRGGADTSRVAFVVGRTAFGDELLDAVDHLRGGGDVVRIVFLDAPDDVLVRRFEDRRRRHPLSGDPTERRAVLDSIAAERHLLDPVKAAADVVIDTSELNVHQLRDRLVALFAGERATDSLTVTVQSFGYKHGLPLDADLVLDVRFLPNPHWVPELRPHSGLHADVRDYVLGQPIAAAALAKVEALLELLLPAFLAEGKAYLTVAIGCTGGRHRSVAIAEALGAAIRSWGHDPKVVHRDIDR